MNCLKYLKRGTENRGGDKKILKKGGGKLGQEVGALKKGGLECPYNFVSSASMVSFCFLFSRYLG